MHPVMDLHPFQTPSALGPVVPVMAPKLTVTLYWVRNYGMRWVLYQQARLRTSPNSWSFLWTGMCEHVSKHTSRFGQMQISLGSFRIRRSIAGAGIAEKTDAEESKMKSKASSKGEQTSEKEKWWKAGLSADMQPCLQICDSRS